MGQVERYGVFALCVVIFLILGIAIWGGGAPPAVTPPAKEVVAAPKTPVKEVNSPLAMEGEQKEAIEGTRRDGKPVSTFPKGAVLPANEGNGTQPEPTPAPAETRTYRIRPKDTLAGIAGRELGDKRKVDVILALNPGLDARKLKLDAEIKLPAATRAGAAQSKTPVEKKPVDTGTKVAETGNTLLAKDADPAKAGKKSDKAADKKVADKKTVTTDKATWPKHYTVAAGDNLAVIARRFYGSDKKSTALAKANGIKDAGHLHPGMTLTLPAFN